MPVCVLTAYVYGASVCKCTCMLGYVLCVLVSDALCVFVPNSYTTQDPWVFLD